jgi:hypothetical protein
MKIRWYYLILWALLSLAATTPPPCEGSCIAAPRPDDAPPAAPLSQPNPALGWSVVETGSANDPLAAFGRRPIDQPRIIPAGGEYQDPSRPYPHYGIDYTYPEAFLNGIPQPVYPIGPGVVTAIHTCPLCWANSTEQWGKLRTGTIEPINNFGFGALVVVEHP